MAEQVAVTVSANPTKVSEMFDANGNKIDPVTRQVITPAEKE